MPSLRPCLAALVVAAAATAAPAGEDARAERAREGLQDFVEMVSGDLRVDEAPGSPTERLGRITGFAGGDLPRILEDAWKRSLDDALPAARLRPALAQVIRFLYGVPQQPASPRAGQLVSWDGVVILRRGDAEIARSRRTPGFRALVRGGKPGAWRRPKDADVVAALLRGGPDGLDEEERSQFAMAAGEACARSGTLHDELSEALARKPFAPLLHTAHAWDAKGARTNRRNLRAVAIQVAGGETNLRWALRDLCAGLERHRSADLHEAFGLLEPAQQDAVLDAAGPRRAAALLCEQVRRGTLTKDAALTRLLPRVVADGGASPPRPADLLLLLPEWRTLAAAEDEGRGTANEAAAAIFRTAARAADAEPAGPYPDATTLLALLDADVSAGRLLLRGRPLGPYDEAPTKRLGDGRAPLPSDLVTTLSPLAVRIGAEWVEGGLQLTLRNGGGQEMVVNGVALRYAAAEVRTVPTTDGGTATELALRLGVLPGHAVTPSASLTPLASGASHTWTVPVRAGHRDADRVTVELTEEIVVAGKSRAPLLARFAPTYVR
jgi:hypothetical protein